MKRSINCTGCIRNGQQRSWFIVKNIKLGSVLPRWFVPVILTEPSVAEGVVLPASRRGRGAALLLGTAPLVRVEGDAGCLIGERSCRRREVPDFRCLAYVHVTISGI